MPELTEEERKILERLNDLDAEQARIVMEKTELWYRLGKIREGKNE